jgi:hypothetical protein
MKNETLASLACAAALACAQSASALTLDQLYNAAVRDSSVVKPNEAASNLIAITPDNDTLVWRTPEKIQVKVVTWQSLSSYNNSLLPNIQTSSNEASVVWVTMAPRVHDFCHQYLATHPHATKEELDLRLKERLGLHYSRNYDVFAELWVHPGDLFRPCVDPGTDDTQCDISFGATVPQVKNIADYPAFYKNLYYGDFRSQPGVPWTGLGYTYDWAKVLSKPKHVHGESEFVLAPQSPYDVDQALSTMEYCSQ